MVSLGTPNEATVLSGLLFVVVCIVTGECAEMTPSTCHHGLLPAGSGCIRFSDRRMLNWKEASAECAALSASLVRFETNADVLAFSAVAKRLPVDGWWTDLTTQNHVGRWTWGNNQAVTNGTVIWNQEPDDVKHAENCVSVNYIGDASDDMCSTSLGYICKATAVADGCDDGWSMAGSSCYYVSDTSDQAELATWQQAVQKCKQMTSPTLSGSTLVSFQTKQEYTSVTKFLPTAYYLGYRWWTGLNDRAVEGRWKWADNSSADTSVIHWEQLPSSLQATEQCGVVHSNGHISYGHCDRDHYYACRYHSIASEVLVEEDLGCPGLWLRAGHKCYVFNTNSSMTRSQAEAFCSHRGGHLLKVESEDQMRWVELQTDTVLSNSFWTGLQRSHNNNQQWEWSDGTPALMSLIHWHMEPNNLDTEKNCAYIMHDVEYIEASCFSQAGFICETQTENSPCPSSWITHSGDYSTSCYYISNTTISAQATWSESREMCRKMSGNDEASLLAVNGNSEQTFIKTQLALLPISPVGWWTDLTDAGHEGAWVYADSWNPAPKSGSVNWAHEPNNYGGKENCTVMYNGGQYNDVPCDALASVACEKMAAGIKGSASILKNKVLLTMIVAMTTWIFR